MPADDLVLLHGFTQDASSWDGVCRELAPRYRPVVPDLPGHGSLADRRPADRDAVLAQLDALVPEGATLAGYSMGGRIALDYACARPGRVRRLVLVSASPGIASAAERRARRDGDEALARFIEREGIEAFARRWAGLAMWAGQDPEVAARAHAMRLAQTPGGLAASLRGLGTAGLPSRWDDLAALDARVELVVGARDAKFRGIAQAMASELADAEVHVVTGASHGVVLDRPAAVAGVLRGVAVARR